MNDPAGDDLAILMFTWIAGNPDLLNRFLGLTGLEPQHLRAFTEEKGFAAAVIGFVAGHEPTLIDFCNDNHVRPEAVSRAWQKLEAESASGSREGDF